MIDKDEKGVEEIDKDEKGGEDIDKDENEGKRLNKIKEGSEIKDIDNFKDREGRKREERDWVKAKKKGL